MLMKSELKILKNLLNFSVVVELHLLNWVLLVFFDRFWNFGEWLMKQLIVCDQPIETVVKGFSQNVNTIMFQKSSFKILKIQWSCNKENFQLVHSCIFWLDVYVWNTIQSYLDIKIEIKKAENVAP